MANDDMVHHYGYNRGHCGELVEDTHDGAKEDNCLEAYNDRREALDALTDATLVLQDTLKE